MEKTERETYYLGELKSEELALLSEAVGGYKSQTYLELIHEWTTFVGVYNLIDNAEDFPRLHVAITGENATMKRGLKSAEKAQAAYDMLFN